MNCLAIIPARGGSKRFPRKNVALLGGKPLVAWSIEAALQSGVAERVMISTEDDEIARIARDFGAEQPFLRPPELASDTARNLAVVAHATEWLEVNQNYRPDYVLILQPTSPLRSAEDIQGAWALACASQARVVTSVTMAASKPTFLRELAPGGQIHALPASGQQICVLNGAIYLARREALHSHDEPALGYVMPPERSVDIDTPRDLAFAEAFLRSAAFVQ
ncbi:MAG: N-acylneuraminate cytidylyltransferase/CMP-N,N'-diacetyllegionaminic acid synthase [Verrucomicrobia bacterium]|nr:MAG: N-acylneuraminate cytidylyltransferase/CMP-N,N'-diacetyllegionaminic acid synthase [Verrucomicrobiota bacterium]